jgi:hypothetical protein
MSEDDVEWRQRHWSGNTAQQRPSEIGLNVSSTAPHHIFFTDPSNLYCSWPLVSVAHLSANILEMTMSRRAPISVASSDSSTSVPISAGGMIPLNYLIIAGDYSLY